MVLRAPGELGRSRRGHYQSSIACQLASLYPTVTKYPIGSLWRRWDLHVHTPASLIHHYPSVDGDPWKAFLDDLERLPPEFAVIGINDYLSIDGYRRVLHERKSGRLKNIETVLPVVELRIANFGGHERLRRINYHVVFSDELDPERIQFEFINAITGQYELSPEYNGRVKWVGGASAGSLEELGRLIKQTVPPEKVGDYGPDLEVGFNNLAFPVASIRQALGRSVFTNKYLTAVGKSEWADIKWNDQSIADKKTIINGVDLVLTAAESPEAWSKSRQSLADDQVNARLLDCSDAHWLSSSSDKDRIGNSFSWVCADPTFTGLKHAIDEFDDRVFVGALPELVRRTRSAPTKYARTVQIRKRAGSSLPGTWFDVETPLNPGFIAVIGNRGQGKSALADTLGLLGSSHTEPDWSFLHVDRFRDPRDNKAQEFIATLEWESNEPPTTRTLDASVAREEPERVKYLPQTMLERICNEIPGQTITRFEAELRSVIFSHIPIAERLGEQTLDELLDRLTRTTSEGIDLLRLELHRTNVRIADLQDKLRPEYRARLEEELSLRQRELRAHDESEPRVGEPPQVGADEPLVAQITALRDERERSAAQLVRHRAQSNEQAEVEARASSLLEQLGNFQLQYQGLVRATQADLERLGLRLDDVVTLEIRPEPLQAIRIRAARSRAEADRELNPSNEGGLAQGLALIDSRIETMTNQLQEPMRVYEEQRQLREVWDRRRKELIGDEATPNTLAFAQRRLAALTDVPAELSKELQARRAQTRNIHLEIRGLADRYRAAYWSVRDFVELHPVAKEIGLRFRVSLGEQGLREVFWNHIHRGVTGAFAGVDEGERRLDQLVRAVVWDDTESVLGFLETLDHLLNQEVGGSGTTPRVSDQLKKGSSAAGLYNSLWGLEYVEPHYQLEMDGQALSQLSPGQKGTLLLVFYLLVDKSDIPLIIDQPEQNLDNHTVAKVLVPALKEARSRRQLVLVTHNPNIAVVGDADQIIHAEFANTKFAYTSAAMENPDMNRALIDVLEGTLPAFKNRSDKYVWEMELASVPSSKTR